MGARTVTGGDGDHRPQRRRPVTGSPGADGDRGPDGVSGQITVTPQPSGSPPAGFELFAEQVVLTGPAAPRAAEPYVATFPIDAASARRDAAVRRPGLPQRCARGDCVDVAAADPQSVRGRPWAHPRRRRRRLHHRSHDAVQHLDPRARRSHNFPARSSRRRLPTINKAKAGSGRAGEVQPRRRPGPRQCWRGGLPSILSGGMWQRAEAVPSRNSELGELVAELQRGLGHLHLRVEDEQGVDRGAACWCSASATAAR